MLKEVLTLSNSNNHTLDVLYLSKEVEELELQLCSFQY